MKRIINRYFAVTTCLGIFLTLLLSIVVFYDAFQKEVFQSLETYASLLDSSHIFDDKYNIEQHVDAASVRVTLIDKDGTVYYDSMAKTENMDNHLKRPEVVEAFAHGNGSDIRKSKTLEKTTFYYAMLLQNGCVLRVSKESDSIYRIFFDAFPVIALILLLIILLCMVWSHFLTKSIVEPIKQMADDMDKENTDTVTTYKELKPFVKTIRMQHENILKNARMRQEFTANVSHELKTPLTSISGYAELISTGMAGQEDVSRFAGEIYHNAQRLLTLINDIIRLSELDGNESMETLEELNLYELARNCVDMLELPAKKQNVRIRLYGNHQCMLLADRQMIEELLYNLCDNAIRYNVDGGSVEVWVEKNNLDRPVLVVKDTGIGIPEEHQSRIFERFYRVDKSRSKSKGGTGLGLAIVKHIIESLDADVELESEPGKGTKIKVTF